MNAVSRRHRFEHLARPQLDALYRTAKRIVGDASLAQEIVQDACLNAYRAFRVENEPAQFRPWLFRILVNLAIDHLRRRGREAGLPVDADPEVALALRDTSPSSDPQVALEGKEIGRAIDAALAELSVELRAVVMLVLIEEMSYGEAAAALAISESLVRSRLGRARDRLRRRLSGLKSGTRAADSSAVTQLAVEVDRRPA